MSKKESSESTPLTMTQYLDYIDNDWAKGWLQRGKAERHGVFVSREFMQAAKGNAYDAILLSQILYWADIDMTTRCPRLRYQYKEDWWIVKTYDEWAEEVCFNSGRTISQCLNRLAKHGLIYKETHKSPFHQTGQVASYVRPNWKGIEAALNNQTTQHVDRSEEIPKRHNMSIQKIHIMSFQKRHIMSILYIQRLRQRLHTETTKKKKDSALRATPLFSTIEEQHGVGVGEDWLEAHWKQQGITPAQPKKERPRNLVFDAISEHVFGIPDTSLLNKSLQGRIGGMAKDSRDSFRAFFAPNNITIPDAVLDAALADTIDRHAAYCIDEGYKAPEGRDNYNGKLVSYFELRKDMIRACIHRHLHPKTVTIDDGPIISEEQQQANAEYFAAVVAQLSANGNRNRAA